MSAFVCVFLMGTLTTAAVASIGGVGVVRPNNPYVYIGNNLTLTCNLTKFDIEYDSRYLTFTRKDDEVIPSDYITISTTRSITLSYPIRSPEDEGHYMCLLNRLSGRPEIVGSQNVIVEYEPKEVENISCRVYNWENMTCEWDLQHKFVHPDFMDIDLVWAIESAGDQGQFVCPHQTETTCSWHEVDTPGDQFVSDATYLMAVSIHNRKTNKMYNSKTIKVDTRQAVQPAPVIDLVANASSTCITTRWSHSKFRREKVYKVEFKEENQVTWNVKHVDSLESLTQCDLKPHTVYLFSVSCRPARHGRPHGFWSESVTISISTKEDVPSHAPQVHPGSYTEQMCQQNNCKKLMLYWKPLDSKVSNGEIVRYRLTYENLDRNEEETIDVASNNYEGTVVLTAGEDYLIRLQAATKVGLSKVPSQLHIPPKDKKPAIPELVVEAHNMSDQTLINLQWDSPRVWTSPHWRNLTSFTIYWCKGYKISQSCYDSIQWQELPVTQTRLSMPVNLYEDSFENYLFGVAVNAITSSGEIISSGLKWNSCTYVLNWKPDLPPMNVRFSNLQPNKGLAIEWDKLGCSDTPAYIQDYLVNICPAESGRNCTGGVTSHTVGNRKSSFTITNLKHEVRYRIWMQAVSKGGMSPNSESIYGVVVDKSLNPGEISGIVIGGLFVLIIFLFGIILCTRRVVRTVQKKFEPVPIDLPPTLPPLPPIPMPPQKWSGGTSPGSSDGIYERIDGPPSPTSSVDSSAGAEAPLIHSKLRLTAIKDQLHNKKKDQRDSQDSGKGSISHSADTLLMRLHPSHLRKARDKKNKERNQSDSGIVLDHRSQASCSYYSGGPSSDVSPYTTAPVSKCQVVSSGGASPYSCVNIVDKINASSEKIKRKMSSGNTSSDGGERSTSTDKSYNTGSTISLPPPSVILQTFQSGPLNFRTKSADNELDYTERKLSCMKEGLEVDSSDVYSEDGNLDDNEPQEQYSGSSAESREPKKINSYIRCGGDGYVQDMNVAMAKPPQPLKCECECHTSTKSPPVTPDGYVKQEVFANGHVGHVCGCEKQRQAELLVPNGSLEAIKVGLRPVSQVMNLPPHFFGSLSTVPLDPSTTTEL